MNGTRTNKSSRPALGALFLLPCAFGLLTLWRVDFLWLEALCVALVLASAALLPRFGFSVRPATGLARLHGISRSLPLSCLIAALVPMVLRLAALPWLPVPAPVVPDEFSHAFLAKTFLAGRLANPPHPLWQHFESIHILSQPTYSSMYMAGQALFLALGKLVTGSLFGGVLISTALFCAALVWFLRAYVPASWALFGAVLMGVRLSLSYWNNSYWGGSVGALGGALALGAYPRLVRRIQGRGSDLLGPAIALAIGIVLLANTRPYEGAGLAAVLCLGLAYEFWKARPRVAIPRFALATAVAAVILCGSGWAMTRQWKAVTGDPLTMPYALNQKIYGWPMTLAWMPVRRAEYRHPELALYRDWELKEHDFITQPAMIPLGLAIKFSFLWRFFFGLTLSAGLLFTREILGARRCRMPWIAGGVVGLMVASEQTGSPHYLAPVVPVLALFLVQGLRHLNQVQAGRHSGWLASAGPLLVRSAIPVMLLLLVVRVGSATRKPEPGDSPNYLSWCCADSRLRDRSGLEQKIAHEAGRHLVIVTYQLPAYDTFEWVYNEPSIDDARIVWARDMGDKNQELLDHFPDRTVWRVTVQPGQWSLTSGPRCGANAER